CRSGFAVVFFFSSRRRHTRFSRDWSSDVCSSDLSWALVVIGVLEAITGLAQLALRATTQDPDRVLLALNLAFVITGLALAGAGLLNRHIYRTAETRLTPQGLINRELRPRLIPWDTKIGRASCRERVYISGTGVTLQH